MQVYGDARVHGNARVYGDAQVYGNALVYGDAQIEKLGDCVSITNQKNTITITPNLIIIGCKSFKTLKEFNKTFFKIGKENSYLDHELDLLKILVNEIHKRMSPIVDKIFDIERNGKKTKELGLVGEEK